MGDARLVGNTASNVVAEPPQIIVGSEENVINKVQDLATEILGKLEQKKETAAAHLGISAAEVETMPFDLTALEQAGFS